MAGPTGTPHHAPSPVGPASRRRPRARPGRLAWLLILCAVGLVTVGCAPSVPASGGAPSTPSPDEAAVSPPPDAAASERPEHPLAASAGRPASVRIGDVDSRERTAPVRVRIPAIDVDAPVVSVGSADGVFDVVDDVVSVGWYRYGPVPGEAGSAVLAAHVDTARDGPGVFFHLHRLVPGERIEVALAPGGTRTFAVESVELVAKRDLSVDELFSREGEPRLALITCGGRFDPATGRYEDNLVVVAVPVS